MCLGDLDNGGTVNFGDLNRVLSEFGQTGEGISGDANGDGVVNFPDLNIVVTEFGRENCY
jgi:Ca2+-binding EF-hand superfamily protein